LVIIFSVFYNIITRTIVSIRDRARNITIIKILNMRVIFEYAFTQFTVENAVNI